MTSAVPLQGQVSHIQWAATADSKQESHPLKHVKLNMQGRAVVARESSAGNVHAQDKIQKQTSAETMLPESGSAGIKSLSEHHTQNIANAEKHINELSEKIEKLKSGPLAFMHKSEVKELKSQLAVAETKLKQLNEQKGVLDCAARLNSASPERQQALDTMRDNLQRLFSGAEIPDTMRSKLSPIPLAKATEEIFRLAPNTIIVVDNKEVQSLQVGCHNRSAPSQPADDANRFSTLMGAYQQFSGESRQIPQERMPKSSSEALQLGESIASDNQLNEKMTRFIRTSTQTLYTGYLPKEDIMSSFSMAEQSFIDGTTMGATITPGSQEITRTFNSQDGTYEVKVKVDVQFKFKDHPVGNVDVTYTLKFDNNLNLQTLQSHAANPKFSS